MEEDREGGGGRADWGKRTVREEREREKENSSARGRPEARGQAAERKSDSERGNRQGGRRGIMRWDRIRKGRRTNATRKFVEFHTPPHFRQEITMISHTGDIVETRNMQIG